ncbi:MAG: FAD-binding protein, partial [Opitutales bacterium]
MLPLEQSDDESLWREEAAKQLEIDAAAIGEIRLKKHSIDARRARIKVQLRLEVSVGGSLPPE